MWASTVRITRQKSLGQVKRQNKEKQKIGNTDDVSNSEYY